MRSILICFALATLAAPADAQTDPRYDFGFEERANRAVQRNAEMARNEAALQRSRGDRPSDVADCRSRGNASYGSYHIKFRVMEDCLEARRLRRAGR